MGKRQLDHAIERIQAGDSVARKYVDYLQSQHTHAVGFLTHIAIQEAIDRGRVLFAFENGLPCGYMIHGKPRDETRILQTVVQDDARRIQHATALVHALCQVVEPILASKISLHCAEDLEANAFWSACGFTQEGKRLKNKTGKRWQLRHELCLPGLKTRDMLARERISAAGVGKLLGLLQKGDARIAQVDFAAFRNHGHKIHLPK